VLSALTMYTLAMITTPVCRKGVSSGAVLSALTMYTLTMITTRAWRCRRKGRRARQREGLEPARQARAERHMRESIMKTPPCGRPSVAVA